MADEPNTPGGAPEKPRPPAGPSRAAEFAKKPLPEVPPSKPLQWFLLVAFVITGAAYLVGEWNQKANNQAQARRQADTLRLAMQKQTEYLAHLKAGDEARAQKHDDQAVAEYRLALQARDTAEGHEYLGQALLKQNNPQEAFAQFGEALRLAPGFADAASHWGLALAAQGKFEDASRVLTEALQHDPHSGLLHYNLAATLAHERADTEGRRYVAENAGKTQEAQADAADAKRLAGDALDHFSKASNEGFNSPGFWFAYGQLLNQLGQYAQAETPLLRSVSKDASLAGAQFQLAVTEDHLGKYAEAIDHYEKTLILTPNDPATLNNLALLYATATNTEARTPKMAVQLATRACDATADQNARYMDTLARSYAAAGDFFQAITWEDKAVHRATQLSDQAQVREFQARQALLMDHKTGD